MPNTKSEIDRMRPIEGHNIALSLRKKCGEEFFQKHKVEFMDVVCPACGLEGKESFVKYGFHHKICRNCSTTWCSPRPTERLLVDYYSSSEATKYWTSLLIQTDNDRKALQYAPRVQHLVDILKNDHEFIPSLAVDLGAGSGAFALALSKTKYFRHILTVDFDEDCCNVCRKSGLEAKKGSIEVLDHNTASLITMNDIVEHLFDPKAVLIQCYEALEPNGYLSIACPNGEGFDFRIMKDSNVNITPPEHLNYFNPHSITLLLESIGFKVSSLETPGILDVQIVDRAFKLGQIQLNENEYIKSLILNNDNNVLVSFQEFLRLNKLSSHMVAIAKKT